MGWGLSPESPAPWRPPALFENCARLARAGREVIVLEAAEAIGTGISSRNSEVVHAGIYYPEGGLKARLCIAGKAAL